MKQTNEPREVRIEGRKSRYLRPADPERLTELLRAYTVLPALEGWADSGRRFTTEYTAPGRKIRLKAIGHGLIGMMHASNTDMLRTRTLQVFGADLDGGVRPLVNIIARSKPSGASSHGTDAPSHYDMFADHSGKPLPLYFRVARQGYYELFAYGSEVFMNKEPAIVKIFPDEEPEDVLQGVLSRLDKSPVVSETDAVLMVPAVPNQRYDRYRYKPTEQITFWT